MKELTHLLLPDCLCHYPLRSMAPLFGIRSIPPRKTIRPITAIALANVRLTGQQVEALKSLPASGVVGHVGQGLLPIAKGHVRSSGRLTI